MRESGFGKTIGWAILFWPLYVINEQHGKTVAQIWDGETLKLSFSRAVSETLMEMWFELLGIVAEVQLVEEEQGFNKN